MAEPGFWPLKSEKVPEKVKLAAKSVYEVYLPGRVTQWNHLHELPLVRREIRQEFGALYQALINQEMNLCEQQRIARCRYSVAQIVGATVFAIENNQFVSVTHSIEPYVDRLILFYGMKKPEIMNLKIPAVLRNGNQYVPVYLKVSKVKTETVEVLQQQLSRHPTAKFEEEFDGIVFTIEGFKAKDFLKIAKEAPTAGEKLYALGYPEATNNRKSLFNVPDADGKNMIATMGESIDSKDMVKIRYSGYEVEVPEQVLSRFITFQGDGNVGMSGGPIVNENGEVVGHTHSIYPHHVKRNTKENLLNSILVGMNIHFLLKD